MATSKTNKSLSSAKKRKLKSDVEKVLVQFDALKTTVSEATKELKPILEKASDKIDSLNEMGEMESLRLQMAMDRLSKMMTTLSNVMKKLSDTQQSIINNIK